MEKTLKDIIPVGMILQDLYNNSPKRICHLSSGIMKINDHMFESVTIAKNLIRKQTSLIFKAKDKFVYEIITRPDVNDTVINILNPASTQKLC